MLIFAAGKRKLSVHAQLLFFHRTILKNEVTKLRKTTCNCNVSLLSTQKHKEETIITYEFCEKYHVYLVFSIFNMKFFGVLIIDLQYSSIKTLT